MHSGNLQGNHSCSKMRNRTCLYQSQKYTCDGHSNNVLFCQPAECRAEDDSWPDPDDVDDEDKSSALVLDLGIYVFISILLFYVN